MIPPKPQNRRVRKSLPPEAPGEEQPKIAQKAASPAWGFVRSFLGLALVVGMACLAAWGARKYVTKSPRFSVQQIVVAGVVNKTPEQVAEKAGLNVGDNVFT